MSAEQRLHAVATSAELRWRREPELVPSDSNDTWAFDEPSRGPVVLRVAWRGDRGRLITEAKVGRALPPTVGYPEVLGYGWTRDEADLTWSLTRRWDGCTLLRAWPELDDGQRQLACRDVADRLQALHRWRPSGAVSDRLQTWSRDDSIDGIVGATLNPLPLRRTVDLLAGADRLPDAGAARLRRAVDWLSEHADLAPTLDRPGLAVTHQDLHLGQVWWDGSRVRGLLDLEWVRFAPAWTDLGRVADNVASDQAEGRAGHAELLAILSDELVHDQDQLRFWRVAFAVRELFVWPHDGPWPVDHPGSVIEELIG